MIMVTRLNGQQFVINAELIKVIESNPDTIVTFINGDRVLVKESMKQVVEQAVDYGRSLRKLLPPT